MKQSGLIVAAILSMAMLWLAPLASAQDSSINQISFNSFTGIYHISRDSHGLSLLTTEETIVADFPGSGFYGITRSLPKNFQNHSVNIKILSVSDAAGDSVPYKTASDTHDNLVITTGDPAITLSGSQIIKTTYQTRGVVNLSTKGDEFLLDVNGRGWDQPFGKVSAVLYIPASFGVSLKVTPSCYLSLNGHSTNNCQINTKKTVEGTVINSSANSVSAKQALILKLDFAPLTFTNRHAFNKPLLAFAVAAAILVVLTSLRLILHKRYTTS